MYYQKNENDMNASDVRSLCRKTNTTVKTLTSTLHTVQILYSTSVGITLHEIFSFLLCQIQTEIPAGNNSANVSILILLQLFPPDKISVDSSDPAFKKNIRL